MKIKIEKHVVEFVPENSEEMIQLGTLWVDCFQFKKKLIPIRESSAPRFSIKKCDTCRN